MALTRFERLLLLSFFAGAIVTLASVLITSAIWAASTGHVTPDDIRPWFEMFRR